MVEAIFGGDLSIARPAGRIHMAMQAGEWRHEEAESGARESQRQMLVPTVLATGVINETRNLVP